MLESSLKVRDALNSLVSGRDIVSVYNNERFCEVVFTGVGQERVMFTCNEVIGNPSVFSCPPYHFTAEQVRQESEPNLFSFPLPEKIVLSQRRKFVRKIFKSSVRVDFRCQQEAFHVINLSMEGIDTESAHAPFAVDQEIHGLNIKLEEGASVVVDARVRYIRRQANGLVNTGFQFTCLTSHDARILQKVLSHEDLWEPGDLALST